jgi:hypothetical protein
MEPIMISDYTEQPQELSPFEQWWEAYALEYLGSVPCDIQLEAQKAAVAAWNDGIRAMIDAQIAIEQGEIEILKHQINDL